MLARRNLLAFLAMLAVAWPAAAQVALAPSAGQPLTLIVPFAPGGPADAMARLLAGPMGASLGQTIVVDNRSGAGGTIGVAAGARAKPDGQTVVLASTGALAVLPHMMARMPYDPARDLAPVSLVVEVPQVLVVSAQNKAASLSDLMALARQQPDGLTYGSAGIGSSMHMAGELLKLRGGLKLTHIPYRGAAPALTELIGGQVNMVLADIPSVVGHVRGGTLRALAITAETRSKTLPDVPTTAEAGLPGVISDTLYAVFAPAGTPPERIAVLHKAVAAALADANVRRGLEDQGAQILGGTPETLAARLRAEQAKWGDVVRTSGVKME
jgi:tripartite-type tricarboxylate transporter receptor subunit TctC